MLKQASKTAIVLATSALAIPYAVAILANILYGWPLGKGRYQRALHPRKVYALNYAILHQLTKLKYIGVFLRYKYFYNTVDTNRLIKNIPYGSNGNSVDLYFPHDVDGRPLPGKRPVVIFVYGGTWGSGDKSMYGLLCAQLADRIQALVCCPNYSLYPRGFVDDMVQDMVDCITWVNHNIANFGGDKSRVALIGHSAGGHLVVLAVLELTIKQLLRNPQSVMMSTTEVATVSLSRQSSVFSESMRFEDTHFNGPNSEPPGQATNTAQLPSDGISGSFYVVDEKEPGEVDVDEKKDTDKEVNSFYVVDGDNSIGEGECDNAQTEDKNVRCSAAEDKEDRTVEGPVAAAEEEDVEKSETEATKESEVGETGTRALMESTLSRAPLEFDVEESQLGIGDSQMLESDSPPRLEPSGTSNMEPPSILVEEDADWTEAMKETHEILSSVKLVIGISGVYNIAEHYEFESWRGVEDISTMAKAMYGPEHFDRLSPTYLVRDLPRNTRVPPIQLIHGDMDKTVPISSSTRLGQALWDMGSQAVHLSVVPGLGHVDACVDLMEPSRPYHDHVMGDILRGTSSYL